MMHRRILVITAIAVLALFGTSMNAASAAVLADTSPLQTPTPTTTHPRHPIALMLSLLFDVEYDDIIALHDSGIGFGVIARAYATALSSDGRLTPEQVLEMHQSGVGWGEIMRQYGLHPGGKGLGSVKRMTPVPTLEPAPQAATSAHSSSGGDSRPGNSGHAPGQNKHDSSGRGDGLGDSGKSKR